jgi:gliding motility-associated-like protein
VKDANGCTFSTTAAINNSNGPTAIATTTTNATCGSSNGSLTLGAVTGGVAPYTYQVDGGGYTATLVYSNLAAGSHTIDVKDANGCIFSTTATIATSGAPTLTITDPSPVCAPSTVDLTAATVTAGSDQGLTLTYWTDNAATLSLANPNAVVVSGTYYIKAVSSGGCSVIKPVSATVNPHNIPNVDVTNPAAVCSPATVDLTNTSITSGSDQGLTYTYWIDSSNTQPIPDPQAVGTSGTYYIMGTASTGCTSTKSVQVDVIVNKPLIPGIRYPTVTTGTNTPVQLNARDLGPGTKYLWQPPVGLDFATVQSPTFNYNQNTQFTITLTPSNGSCPTTDTLLVQIVPDNGSLKSALNVPTAFSPNGDGHNDKLYPLTINVKELKYFRVYNRWGQLMFETKTLGQGWDGTFNGVPQVMDVYTWIVEAYGEDGVHYKQAGNTILMR